MAGAGDLCTVEEVKQQVKTRESQQEPLLETLISTASAAIADWTQREFTPPEPVDPDDPDADVTRTFLYSGGGYLWLAPYDLRAATTVVVDGVTTLDVTTGYVLRPVPTLNGVYDRLEIRGSLPFNTYCDYSVAVTGSWGWPSVPPAVKQACIVTVRAWFARDGGLAYQDDGFGGGPVATPNVYWLPASARRLLSPYRRIAIC